MQLLLMEDQQVVKALSSHTAQKAFTDGIGSWRLMGCFENLNAARCCNSSETRAKLVIIIAKKILWCLSRGELPPAVVVRSKHQLDIASHRRGSLCEI